jgi:CheY-like chemotaxis protein
MEPEILRRLFEPFSQADRSLARSRGGLGLGLALVKGLVELHGGLVQAESPGPGQGSEFTILLPLTQMIAAPKPPESTSPSVGHSLGVLVIEDHQDVAESLRIVLELFGYRVTVSYTGPAGLEAFHQVRPDVVLCDIGLPGGMDGYAVARALREAQGGRPLHLIAVSGYGQEEDQRRALQAGFDRHLTKPIDPKQLRQILEALER